MPEAGQGCPRLLFFPILIRFFPAFQVTYCTKKGPPETGGPSCAWFCCFVLVGLN